MPGSHSDATHLWPPLSVLPSPPLSNHFLDPPFSRSPYLDCPYSWPNMSFPSSMPCRAASAPACTPQCTHRGAQSWGLCGTSLHFLWSIHSENYPEGGLSKLVWKSVVFGGRVGHLGWLGYTVCGVWLQLHRRHMYTWYSVLCSSSGPEMLS